MRLTRRITLPTGLEICLGVRPLPPGGPQERPEGPEDSADARSEASATATTPPADIG